MLQYFIYLWYIFCVYKYTTFSLYQISLTDAGNSDKGIVGTLPKHLKEYERLPLQEIPESIFEKTSMGASSFSLFLHQNYLNFFSNIESVAKAAHYLSDSDVLTADWMVSIMMVV